MNEAAGYPWYAAVRGDELLQGDILEDCPVLLPVLPADTAGSPGVEWVQRDVVVLSQSCDMVAGREKVVEVLLCATYKRSEIEDQFLKTSRGMEEARRGNLPGIHLLAKSELPGLERELRVVSFRRLFSLPIALLRKQAAGMGPRLRLLPPYREHLAQSFARYFMRVGLPADIPPFK
ncbi:MAG: hypothetical protein K1X57_00590 [Gemmataceae bacterium]|nr:hypothetical protein [Gemmataceae bacterium]